MARRPLSRRWLYSLLDRRYPDAELVSAEIDNIVSQMAAIQADQELNRHKSVLISIPALVLVANVQDILWRNGAGALDPFAVNPGASRMFVQEPTALIGRATCALSNITENGFRITTTPTLATVAVTALVQAWTD